MQRLFPVAVTFVYLLTLAANAAFAQPAKSDAASALDALIEEAWQFELDESPSFAMHVGDPRGADQLGSEKLADIERRNDRRQQFLDRLQKIDRASLARPNQINYDIFQRELENSLAEFHFQTHLTPITNRSGFHIGFPELAEQAPLRTVTDYENYIARLRGFRQYAREHIELMRHGVEAGQVLPAIVLEGYEGSITPHIVDDVTKSLLYRPLERMPESFSEADRERLTAAATEAIRESVVPGYRDFLQYMRDDYVPAARGSIGASALPNGRDFYRHRVRQFTTLDITPEQVHEIGLNEVQRIRKEMETIAANAGYNDRYADFLDFLRTDEQFYANSPEQLQAEVALILKRMDGRLPELFGRLPRMPYGLKQVPAYIAPKTTSAYYMMPSGDGRRAGYYFINTYNLKSRPLFEMEALSLHEAVPGHHLQLALQQELDDLPAFRRFNNVTAFVEGWALYAERLGLEVGFYQDPYRDFGRLSFEMWRACRLVVDTGIHYLGWSREQAIEFMAENTALSRHNIEAEVDRYISWPGQALAYKMGELKIRELRSFAETELGERFDIRQFHDIVLGSGSVPLAVLEENVRLYVQETTKPADR
ncbi:MAG: DUF885 domain-containing protein [Pirellulaceae bacterium]